jgi:DNA-binding MarR family transcriptional regulator
MDTRELQILEYVASEPDITQPTLAAKLGVAVGTVNWYIKRLVAKGYVKVTRLQRKRLRYLLTPTGLAEKTSLTVAYMEQSMSLYRMTRERARELVGQVRKSGHEFVVLEGAGDLADVVRLTCLEHGVEVIDAEPGVTYPVLRIAGLKVELVSNQPPAQV